MRTICLVVSLLFSGCLAPGPPPGLYAVVDLRSGEIRQLPGQPADLLANAEYRTTKMVFRHVAAGTFTMGAPQAERQRPHVDETQHQVTLSSAFCLGVFEVTQGQWQTVMGGAGRAADDQPAVNVSWHDCGGFIRALNRGREGAAFRFPTEAEWEYACRAGSTGAYAGAGVLDDLGWCAENSGQSMKPVGLKKPNAWGLYDMHGNVMEWCSDWYGAYPRGEVVAPAGPAAGTDRVERGGSWYNQGRFSRSADRNMHDPATSSHHLGLRLVLAAPEGKAR